MEESKLRLEALMMDVWPRSRQVPWYMNQRKGGARGTSRPISGYSPPLMTEYIKSQSEHPYSMTPVLVETSFPSRHYPPSPVNTSTMNRQVRQRATLGKGSAWHSSHLNRAPPFSVSTIADAKQPRPVCVLRFPGHQYTSCTGRGFSIRPRHLGFLGYVISQLSRTYPAVLSQYGWRSTSPLQLPTLPRDSPGQAVHTYISAIVWQPIGQDATPIHAHSCKER